MESFVNKRITHTKPEYTFYSERLSTYTCWPIQITQTKDSLARAGFWYTGFGDKVQCFSCGIALMKWAVNDDPWKEHETFSKDCQYLKMTGFSDEDRCGADDRQVFFAEPFALPLVRNAIH